MNDGKIPHIKSIETRHLEEREALFRGLHNLDRRAFLKISTGAAAAAVAAGVNYPFHSFLPISVAYADDRPGFNFAYISDSHLYVKAKNERFIRQLLRAVDDVNALDPQPDFVLYGGDLAQLGRKEEALLAYSRWHQQRLVPLLHSRSPKHASGSLIAASDRNRQSSLR